MLTPLALFIIHVHRLSEDFTMLKTEYSSQILIATSALAFSVIPLIISIDYYQDRQVLHSALNYIYSPNYSENTIINKTSLDKTLNVIKNHKNRSFFGMSNNKLPYLSSYYNRIVLDKLTLSDSKIRKLDKIFFDRDDQKRNRNESRIQNNSSEDVSISNIDNESTYDPKEEVWTSWINIELTNYNKFSRQAEYETTIDLPEGSWISDYYLYVEDRKEMGILAEKKTALWVYNNIRNTRRDPGILYYLTDYKNKIGFKVFPFLKDQKRKTGIQILHKEPITIKIDDHELYLGSNQNEKISNPTSSIYENEMALYFSLSDKRTLPKHHRSPYIHFLIDASSKIEVSRYLDRVKQLLLIYPSFEKKAKISFVNSEITSYDYNKNLVYNPSNHDSQGTYFLERGIKSALFHNYYKDNDHYPVMISVTDSLEHSILPPSFSNWEFTFPESPHFYSLLNEAYLERHSLNKSPKKALETNTSLVTDHHVLKYESNNQTYYLPDNNQATVTMNKIKALSKSIDRIPDKWDTALELESLWRAQILHPEEGDKKWLDLIKKSFQANILSPVTSFMVVENEAQKAMLKRKQKEVLNGNKNLDLDEDSQRMSEPDLYLMILFMLGFYFFFKSKKNI